MISGLAQYSPDLAEVEHPAIIESCHSIWVFDVPGHRFRRILKGVATPVVTSWRDYDHFVVDDASDGFLVFLDSSGSRVLRSTRHTGATCERCAENPTAELSLEQLGQYSAAQESLA